MGGVNDTCGKERFLDQNLSIEAREIFLGIQ
jgi:hypothetical protein